MSSDPSDLPSDPPSGPPSDPPSDSSSGPFPTVTDEEEGRFLALLREVHRFPMAYDVRVICLAATAEWLADRLVAETGLPLVGPPTRRESAAGRYVSLTLHLLVQDAPDVVRAYRAIRVMEGVKSYF